MATLEACLEAFQGNHHNEALADLIEKTCPDGACEVHSIGQGSPGPVDNAEAVDRLVVSPRDFDPNTQEVLIAPFEKVFRTGLSVMRSCAPDDEVAQCITENLRIQKGAAPREVYAVLRANVGDIRAEQSAFKVYDQTVPRVSVGEPFPHHAGIFLRLPPVGSASRKKAQKDFAAWLRQLFRQNAQDVNTYRGGLGAVLNGRSLAGEFIVDPDT